MRFGTISLDFYDEYMQCFQNKEVEVVGQLISPANELSYLIRKHLSTTTGGGSPLYSRLERHAYKWISYDGGSLYLHQGNERYRAYLWVEADSITIHPQLNTHAKHLLQKLEDE